MASRITRNGLNLFLLAEKSFFPVSLTLALLTAVMLLIPLAMANTTEATGGVDRAQSGKTSVASHQILDHQPSGSAFKKTRLYLKPGDVIELSGDLPQGTLVNNTLIIPANHRIDLPLIGEINTRNLSLEALENTLNTAYQTFFISPDLSVSLKEEAPIQVSIQGAVKNPGIYTSGQQANAKNTNLATLGQNTREKKSATLYLLDLLIQSGGLLPNADYSAIQIYHNASAFSGKDAFETIDLTQYYRHHNNSVDVALFHHDKVIVPQLPPELLKTGISKKRPGQAMSNIESRFKVTVLGAVKKPGEYTISADQTYYEALAMAGGPDKLASLDSVFLLRENQNGQVFKKRLAINTSTIASADTRLIEPLMPGDTLFVDDSTGKKVTMRFFDIVNRAVSAFIFQFLLFRTN